MRLSVHPEEDRTPRGDVPAGKAPKNIKKKLQMRMPHLSGKRVVTTLFRKSYTGCLEEPTKVCPGAVLCVESSFEGFGVIF